jgi:hypothetical protein
MGMILYPTDDEIIALKESVLNVQRNESKTFTNGISCFIEAWNIHWWIIIYNLQSLKINETVLG